MLLQGLEGAVGLKALVLSFNELTSMEGLTSLTRLTSLDLSFNSLSRIQGLKVRVTCMFLTAAGLIPYGQATNQVLLFTATLKQQSRMCFCNRGSGYDA